MVRELGVEHIERNCIWDGISFWREDEFRFAVYELRDEPRGADAIDLWPWTRKPRLALILPHVQFLELPRASWAFGAPNQHGNVMPARAVEKIDRTNLPK